MQASLRQVLQDDDDEELLDELVARGMDVDAAATKVLPGYTLEVMRAVGIPMKYWPRLNALSRPGTQQTRVFRPPPSVSFQICPISLPSLRASPCWSFCSHNQVVVFSLLLLMHVRGLFSWQASNRGRGSRTCSCSFTVYHQGTCLLSHYLSSLTFLEPFDLLLIMSTPHTRTHAHTHARSQSHHTQRIAA